jgi:hypothetical protein
MLNNDANPTHQIGLPALRCTKEVASSNLHCNLPEIEAIRSTGILTTRK